ncbi:MAG: ribonucleoside triphosphate reductase [Sphaerochaetaceae bacterium]|nr:ribonucleoside triphosphate reductase [Sphaerochaetaceae bacterium]
MISYVTKRNGERVLCDRQRIIDAVQKAADASGETLDSCAISQQVLHRASVIAEKCVSVETLQDIVENVLMEKGHYTCAKAYILYRNKRQNTRDEQLVLDRTKELFSSYLEDESWEVKENANTRKSINGMNNFIRESFTRQYWLGEIYPDQVSRAHTGGAMHIHDLGFFGPYCAGWDLRQLLTMGFGGISGKVSSRPARHLRSFLAQVVNSTFTTQGESAGAQAWSSLDTYCAPFIRYDDLSEKEVKQTLQEFVFSLNVPTRVGFQCPFSNVTLDLTVPNRLKDQGVIIGGEIRDETYGEFQREMDMFNNAFFSVMMEGDSSSRVFTFPIPTINVTKDFPWDSPVVDNLMEMTGKYGIPYFSNYVNSDLDPDDALSMCCRLRLDTSELRKRGGGLFGSNPLTGSIGVVTLNLPRLAYESENETEFFDKVRKTADLAKTSLEIKRKVIEKETERGMYPFSRRYLQDIKEREGSYWANHFSTIGIVGLEEAGVNLHGTKGSLTTDYGQDFGIRTLNTLRQIVRDFQKETHHNYNLEATPAEGTSYRLAKKDTEEYPGIYTAGEEVPYYTNSSQLPVSYTSDIFETLEKQDELQSLYTGGTVLHLYLGERVSDIEVTKSLIRKIFTRYKLPYISITPIFSTCSEHGYISGEHHSCPICNRECEVWTRVVGYLRPVNDFHKGKKEEHRQRKVYTMEAVS